MLSHDFFLFPFIIIDKQSFMIHHAIIHTESDVELFEMNGVEYVRRDIEGSDSDTRRRTAVDFVKGLCVCFEERITKILLAYTDVLLQV